MTRSIPCPAPSTAECSASVHWTMRCIFRPRAKIRIIGGDNQLRVFLPPGSALLTFKSVERQINTFEQGNLLISNKSVWFFNYWEMFNVYR